MLKYVLLAGAMTVSMPALAQDKPADTPTAPTTQVAPAQTAPDPATTAQPQTVTPADPQATPQDSTTAAQQVAPDQTAQPTQQATAEPAVTGAAQIAQVVSTEFPSYDKDKSGTLNEKEFGTWMVALKEKSDPSTKPDSPATKAWVDQAFASADKDKSKSLTKAELTGFLTQGA